MKNKLKIHKNPQKAFHQGLEIGRKDGLRNMFTTYCYVMLPAMDFERDENMTDEEFADYASRVENRIQSILDEYFDGDVVNVVANNYKKEETLKDRVHYFMEKIFDLREKYKLDEVKNDV